MTRDELRIFNALVSVDTDKGEKESAKICDCLREKLLL